MQTPLWAEGMLRVAPGVYVRDHQLHIDAVEICEFKGWPVNEESLRRAEAEAVTVYMRQYANFPVAKVAHPRAHTA